jgi:hypothetical protein
MGKVVAVERVDFNAQIKRLAGLRFSPATTDTHWDVLHHVEVDTFARAVSTAQRECSDFPSPAELLAIVARTGPRVGQLDDRGKPMDVPRIIMAGPLRLAITREWTYYCERCSDTGFASWWCNGSSRLPDDDRQIVGALVRRAEWMESGKCDYDREHLPHEYVSPCACARSNPAVLKAKERAAQQAASRTAKRDRDAAN